MRLYDGTGEYVRADELAVGDVIRCPDVQWRQIVYLRQPDAATVLISTTREGQGEYILNRPAASRVLRKVKS